MELSLSSEGKGGEASSWDEKGRGGGKANAWEKKGKAVRYGGRGFSHITNTQFKNVEQGVGTEKRQGGQIAGN